MRLTVLLLLEKMEANGGVDMLVTCRLHTSRVKVVYPEEE